MENKIARTCGANSLTVYNAPEGAVLNNEDFAVEFNCGDGWVKAPVYRMKTAYSSGFRAYNCFRSSMVQTDIEGKIDVRVTSLAKNIEFCKIRPLSDNIKFNFDRTTVTFSVDRPLQLSLEINGNTYSNLHLFFNPIEQDIPDKADQNVIYIPAGVHTIDNCEHIKMGRNNFPVLYVYSNQTLYLEGGAVVKASVCVMGDNVKILGRGIIDVIDSNAVSSFWADLPDRNIYPWALKLDHGTNILVDGIVIKNPCHYGINGSQCENLTINNVKVFACHNWSDGIDLMCCRGVRISNCFVRSNDDSIAVYARRWDCDGNCEDWEVTNCVLWADSAHPVNIGSHGTQSSENRAEIRNMHFSDIDVLEVNCTCPVYWGVVAVGAGDENYIHDLTFENFRVDDFTCSSLFFVEVEKNGDFNPVPGYAVENITFKDFYYNGINRTVSSVRGYDNERKVKNVTFDNIVINGKKIESFEEANIKVGDFAENIIIK